MSLLKLMSERYTCRRYSSEEVKEEDLLKILEAAKLAPTAHNNQPQKIYVIKSKEAREKLLTDFPYNYKAPCYLVCAYDELRLGEKLFNENGEIDVAIAITHMMLMAEELGLGTCWIGNFSAEDVRERLRLPKNEKIVAVLSIGYHREDDRPSKLHFINREDDELIIYL
ncbi:nitroreductase family protein [Fusobacterium sp.]|uniref:nitroreductase family protein n=1 Tax=Fusobacterium sp. TaxID=68766 RepID=UPI0025C1F67C|nr:nitroreductase family protein [Fusobacterium sp.]MCI7223022.1 nitroreductase family protein [Fusobacterium sp.]